MAEIETSTAQFFSMITATGLEKLRPQGEGAGVPTVELAKMAVGDGAGNPVEPSEDMTSLVNEQWRGGISELGDDPDNPTFKIVEAVIPFSEGGWFVREIGIYDTDGDLFAIGNMPPEYKPAQHEGALRDLVIRFYIELSNASNVSLNINPSHVVATRAWVVNVAIPNALTMLDDKVDEAASHADRAEIARDAAFVNADVYEDVPTGLASGDEQFQVVEGDDIVRYRRVNASNAEPVARYPAATQSLTQGWRGALDAGIGIERRIGDNPHSYTQTLAGGGPENRPSLALSAAAAASTGFTYVIDAPSVIARREMINLRANTGVLRVDILTGQVGESNLLDGNYQAGIGWFKNDRTPVDDTPISIWKIDSGIIGNTFYSDEFTFGVAGSGADLEAPVDAIYAIPFFEVTGTSGRFYASRLEVRAISIDPPAASGSDRFAGQSPDSYTYNINDFDVHPVPENHVSFGGAGARIGLVVDSVRSVVGLRGLLPVDDKNFNYDIYYGLAALGSADDGTIEIGASWFDANKNKLSDTVASEFPRSEAQVSVSENVIRSNRFEPPEGARYARIYLRLTGNDSQLAVLKFYAKYTGDSEFYGKALAGHPSRIFNVTTAAHAYDVTSPASRAMTGNEVRSVIDDISSESVEYLGGALVRPEFQIVGSYPAIKSPDDEQLKARLSTNRSIIYSPPSLLVFAAYADSSVTTLRPLIHQRTGDESHIRINANALRTHQGNWLSTPGRVGFAIDGATDGASSDGNPLAVSLPQNEWGVISLVLKVAPERSEVWCGGELVDTFLCPENITDGRTDFFSAINTSWDTNGVALGRIFSAAVAATDDQRMAVEKWVAEPGRLPLSVQRLEQKPVLQGTSFAVTRVSDGTPLFEQDPDARQNPASIVKLIVALIAHRWIVDWDTTFVTLDGDQHGLLTGDVISVTDAVSAMLMPSNNVTPTAIGLKVGEIIQGYEGVQNGESARDRAYREMRNVSLSLGMMFPLYDGFFGGTANGTQLSAIDICRAMSHAYSIPRVMSCMSRGAHAINVIGGPTPRSVEITTSVNFLVDGSNKNHDIIAGKTGTTSTTGESLTVLAKMPGGDVVAAALLGSPSDPGRYAQMRTMLDYVRRKYFS